MTFAGHILTGLSLGVLAMPRRWPWNHKAAMLLSYVVLALGPDWKFPGWGHYRYDISHGLMMNLLIVGVPAIVLLLWAAARRKLGGTAVIVGGVAAELAHLLLDSFYNHGNGVMIGWPFNRYHLNLAMPWFRSMVAAWNLDFARVIAIELLFYGSLLVVCLSARRVAISVSLRRKVRPGPL